MGALDMLEKHDDLSRRMRTSSQSVSALKDVFKQEPSLSLPNITCFCAGSLGRLEAGMVSDLDVFVISKDPKVSKLQEVRLLSKIADLNDQLNFPPFSDEMRYMKVYDSANIINDTGKPRDDSENSFTTRMLLLLESAPLINPELYAQIANEVCKNYFRDNKGKKDFRPLFLINDLLRYWRTLCLNYEQCREDPNKPWRKKNVNLRFSRLTTVFSTVALLMVKKPVSENDFMPWIGLTPLQRLATAVDALHDNSILKDYADFLDHYSTFLRIKDNPKPEKLLEKGNTKEKMRGSAQFISNYFYKLLQHKSLDGYSQYLML